MRSVVLAWLLFLSGMAAAEELPPAEIASRAELAARYMVAAQRPDGLFIYEHDFISGSALKRDNIVRQAGASYALAEYLAFNPDKSLARTTKWALAALAESSVPFGDGLAVAPADALDKGSTGATALALLAELHYSEATGDWAFSAPREKWLTALLALQRPAGGFRMAPGVEEESSYFNGETWLALAHVERLFPGEPRVRTALEKADAYMIERYGKAPDTQFAHWGLMAASVRYDTSHDNRFLDFIASLAGQFLETLRPEVKAEWNTCSAVEGLAAGAVALLQANRDSEPLFHRMVERSKAELAKGFGMQIAPNDTRIILGKERFLVDPAIGSSAGAFRNGLYSPLARIDLTQHCLSAMMKYAALQRLRATPE